VWNVCCNLVLAVLFLPKFVNPGDTLNLFGYNLPIGFVAFSIFHDSFWFANGLFLTVSASMVADVSEIDELESGKNKDGCYSAVYNFFIKVAMSAAMLVAGYVLTGIGMNGQLKPGASYPADTVWWLAAATILIGPAVSIFSLIPVKLYTVDNAYLIRLRAEHAQCKAEQVKFEVM
jgi:GPH family glycoside/pentoside/hexuronide:cation symporter